MTVVYALCSDKSESSEKTRIHLLRCSAFFQTAQSGAAHSRERHTVDAARGRKRHTVGSGTRSGVTFILAGFF